MMGFGEWMVLSAMSGFITAIVMGWTPTRTQFVLAMLGFWTAMCILKFLDLWFS